jgi:hypothetical protein
VRSYLTPLPDTVLGEDILIRAKKLAAECVITTCVRRPTIEEWYSLVEDLISRVPVTNLEAPAPSYEKFVPPNSLNASVVVLGAALYECLPLSVLQHHLAIHPWWIELVENIRADYSMHTCFEPMRRAIVGYPHGGSATARLLAALDAYDVVIHTLQVMGAAVGRPGELTILLSTLANWNGDVAGWLTVYTHITVNLCGQRQTILECHSIKEFLNGVHHTILEVQQIPDPDMQRFASRMLRCHTEMETLCNRTATSARAHMLISVGVVCNMLYLGQELIGWEGPDTPPGGPDTPPGGPDTPPGGPDTPDERSIEPEPSPPRDSPEPNPKRMRVSD